MFWTTVARFILKQRITLLVVITLVTVVMVFQFRKLHIDYGYSGMLPESDSVSIKLKEFNNLFGEDGNLFFFGFQDPDFFTIEKFQAFSELKRSILAIDGVTSVLSVYDAVNLLKHDEERSFEVSRIFPEQMSDQVEMDSLVAIFRSLPIYRNLVYTAPNHAFFVMMMMDQEMLNTSKRPEIILAMKTLVNEYEERFNIKMHYSGLPYVRTEMANIVQREFLTFIFLAAFVTLLILFAFFRSLRVVLLSALVLGLGVVWAIGSMVLMGYNITILNAMVPAVLIVIGVPNCIFLLNKYHAEYRKRKNKMAALEQMIRKVGSEIFLTNLTTASGFATFMVIRNETLSQFGQVASINIMLLFLLCLTLIPILFSFVSPPNEKQVKHLENRVVNKIIDRIIYLVQYRRIAIYAVVALILVTAVLGITRMKSTGYILDDIPKENALYKDLKFFEGNIRGVMPLEVAIDSRKPNGVMQQSFLNRVEAFQEYVTRFPDMGQPLSLVDALKMARQAYYNGNEAYYRLPGLQERAFLLGYLSDEMDDNSLIKNFMDSSRQIMRVNCRVGDVGTHRLLDLSDSLQTKLDELFPPESYKTILTGSSLKFTLGTEYLIKNLFQSLALAILFISIVMAWMYRSLRMVVISVLGNMIPLLFTAGLMGFAGISIKPSTVLVFSVAYGMAVDTAIHFLAKFRQHLSCPKTGNSEAIIHALREVGVSVIYTVCVLFLGFGIFVVSEFGGTKAMGFLVSITLLIAVISNLLLVPSLLMGQVEKLQKREVINKHD